jgi:hypothetical protein
VTTLAQTKAIHALRRKIPHYTDDDYRAYLHRAFGVGSSKDLTTAQAERARKTLQALAGDDGKVRRASVTAEGPFAKKLQALWISAYHLGVVRSRDDKAMIAFVQRQAKVSHTRFLTDPADAKKAIEALKSWLAREAGVEWPVKDESAGAIDTKRAVAKAACRRMVEMGAFDLHGFDSEQSWPSAFVNWAFKSGHVPVANEAAYQPEHWDAMTAAAGRRMRVKAGAKTTRAA